MKNRGVAVLRLIAAIWLLPMLFVMEAAEKLEDPTTEYWKEVLEVLLEWWDSVVEYLYIIWKGETL